MNKKNFSVKIFIGITCILLAVGLLVFGILRIFIPKIYANNLDSRIDTDAEIFVKEFETAPKSKWLELLIRFCYKNNVNATIYETNGLPGAWAGIPLAALSDYKLTHPGFDIPSALRFYYVKRSEGIYTVVFYVNPQLPEQVTDTFETMFPILFVGIFIISMVIAFFYTRFMVKNRNLQNAIEEEKKRRSFFSSLSHELKTPVTILKGELDGMILNVGKFKDRDKYLAKAYKTTGTIEKIVKEIMTAAKLDTLKITPEEINLSELTNEYLQKIGDLIEKKEIKIKQNFSGISITADKNLMGIVISNVIGNAVKHSPEGTEINIHFDNNANFTVFNYGAKASPETDLTGGLGLYIVKSILDMHGFKYSFENSEGGTLFSINLKKML
jgi:hypothetical protein